MQNQQIPGQAAPPVYAPNWVPQQKQGFFAKMSLWEKIKLAGIGVLVVVSAGIAVVMYFKSQKNVVLFENSFDEPGELLLNGKSYGTIAPHQHVRLELDSGTFTVGFNSGGKTIEDGKLNVVASKGGLGTMGYRAVYNVGGHKGLAVLTKFYGGSFKDSARLLEEGQRVAETPMVELAKIDEGFPASITVKKGQSFGQVTRVCHVDVEKETVGCPGW